MRVGIDAYPLTVQGGGIRRYTENLVRGLARLDPHVVYTLFRSGAEAVDSDLSDSNVRAHHVEYPFRRWLDHLRVPGIRRHADLYHGTNYFSPLLDRLPTVLTIHDLSVRLFPDRHPVKRRVQHRLVPTMCRRASRIIAVSANTRDDLVEHFEVPREKIDVIRLAVSDSFRRVSERETLRRVRARYRLPNAFALFVGALEPRKNLPLLIRSIGELSHHGPRLPLVLAGSGGRRYVEKLAEATREAGLVLGHDVILTGFVGEDDLPALYSLCEFLVYPSVYEGFGLPPLEAMACGAPVVVPRCSSLSELYGDCAMTFDLGSEPALVSAMGELSENTPLRENLIELGLKRAQERSWGDVARETLAVYERVMRRSESDRDGSAGRCSPHP